ncbi:hypothetical protein SAMN00120144_0192 [Hymenobacter roseosalivarius DSM 11622]|uniref:Uncharacterized protein n=1 Tax=Hymenobacter roseosalivarius DSM 11622 TaxID=645990 RepID=A0A1W1W1C4_9BACT|nr:hypothetical protein [Hymenobacter roseosalivarius]SMB99429.1 hypothetical protein SAMN00120144_0192 [Hymenobacter roseosalivarius DSM 11622]
MSFSTPRPVAATPTISGGRRRFATVLLATVGLLSLNSCAEEGGGIGFEPNEGGAHPTQRNRPVLPATAPAESASFIDPTATITGDEAILIGPHVYIGPFARLLASGGKGERGEVRIEEGTNLQDNVTVMAEAPRDAASQR